MDDEDSQDEQIIRNTALRKGTRQTPAIISEESSGSSGNDTDDDDEAEEVSEVEAEGMEDGSDFEEDDDDDGAEEETEDTGEHVESADNKSAKCAALSSDEDAENCPICLNVFRDQVVGTPENCAHYFCLDCILEWSKNASSCPVDRITFSCICIRAHFGGSILKKVPIESRTAQDEEEDDITNCQVCGRSDREDRLLLCDGCDSGYHMECLMPPLSAVPVDEWFCPQCEAENLPSNDADSLSDEEAIIPQLRVAPSTSRSRINGMRTRAIARTRQSERVRASVNQHRIRTAQRIQHVPNYLTSSLLDETIETVVAGLNTAVYQRPLASRSTTNQIAKPGRKKKRTGKKKPRTKSGTRSRSKGKKSGRRRRRKKAKKLKPAKDVTVRSRIAKTLGLCKPVRGVSIPAVQRAVEPSLGCLRADIGAASLSVFGDPYELDPFDSNEEHPVSPASPLSAKRRILSRSALRSHQPVARPISVGLSRSVAAPIREPVAETAPLPDLLGSILTGQNFLMMDSSDIVISRDGSLMAKNITCLSHKSLPNESRNGETQRYYFNPGPMPSGVGMSTLTAESPKLVLPPAQAQPASVSRITSSPSLFLPRGLERALNPMARSSGTAAEQLHNAIVSSVPPFQNFESMKKLVETPRFNGDSKQASRSLPIATPTHNTISCVKNSPTRHLSKPSVRLDISELPRIPKIKRDESGEHPKSANGTGSVGIPSSCINHLTGKGDSSQPSRFTTVQNNKSSGRESQEQHSHAGDSSTFTNISASGGAASHVSGGSRVLEAQSGGGFRITISGNAGHSSRLFSPSSYDPLRNTDKVQQKPSSPSCVNSSKKAKPVKSEIYDPFDPTGSDSSSAHSSPERTEPQAEVPTNSAKIGTFRSFRFFTTMPKISVSRLGPVFSDAPSPSPPRSTELRSDSVLKQIIIERNMETMAEKVIKVENDNTDEENNHIAASCTTRSVRLTPELELEHWKAKINEDAVAFHEAVEPGDTSVKAEQNPKVSLGKETQQKATEKHQHRRTESSSRSRSNSSSRSQKKPKKEKKSLSKKQRKTPSRSRSRERSSRSASWSTDEDRSKKARYKSKGHRASSGHSSSSSRERYKKKKVKDKKSKSSSYWERKRSRSGSPSPDHYYSRKKKKRRSRSHSRGRERSWSSSDERAKRRKHKRDRSHDRYDKRESGSRGRERWRSRSRDRRRPHSRSHSREYKRAKSRDRWLHTKERYTGSKNQYYSPHRRKVAGISIDSTVKHSSTKLQMWHPSEEQAKSKQKASGVALVEEKDLKESMKRERIREILTDDNVKTGSIGSQGSPEPFVSPTQWELIDDISTHADSLYDSIPVRGGLKSANSDIEYEPVAGCTIEKEETWINEKDVDLVQALPENPPTVREDKERASETLILDIKEEEEKSELFDVNGDAVDHVLIEPKDASEPTQIDLRGYVEETAGLDLGGYVAEPMGSDLEGYYVEPAGLDLGRYAAEPAQSDIRGYTVEPTGSDLEGYPTEPMRLDFGTYAVEPGRSDLGGYAAEPEQSDLGGYAAEPEQSDLGGYTVEPGQSDLGEYAVEPGLSDIGGYASEPEQSDLGEYTAEPGRSDLGEYTAEPGRSDLGEYTAEPGRSDLGEYTAEPGRSDLGEYTAEPGRSDLGEYTAEPGRSDLGEYTAEPGQSDLGGYPVEPGQSDLGGYAAESAQLDLGGYAAKHVLMGLGEEAAETILMDLREEAMEPMLTSPGEETAETALMELREAAMEPVLTDLEGEAVEPSPTDLEGEAVEPVLTDLEEEAMEPALTGLGGEAVEPVLMGLGGEATQSVLIDIRGEATEPTLMSLGGETAEPALMDEEEAALTTTVMSAEEKTIVTTVIEEKEVASETSMMEWEEEALEITAMKVKEETSMMEEEEDEDEEGKVDQLLKKLKPQSISEEPVLKSKSLVKRVTWNLQDEESDPTAATAAAAAAEKTPRVPFYKQQRAREAPWKVTEMSNPILNQVITQNSPLALPLPVSIPPYAPVSEPTVQFFMQGSVPLLTGVAGAGLIPEPGCLVTACEPGAEAASIGESENQGKPPKQAPEKMKNEEYLKKLHIQERAVEEVKLAIKPFYQKREITKDEYKDILRKAVQKICHSKSGEINPVKVANLVKAYVERYKHMRKYKRPEPEEDQDSEHQTPA